MRTAMVRGIRTAHSLDEECWSTVLSSAWQARKEHANGLWHKVLLQEPLHQRWNIHLNLNKDLAEPWTDHKLT